MKDTIVFTSASLLDLLTQIEELSDLSISLSESGNSFQLKIGDTVYDISTAYAQDVDVEEDVVETVDAIDEDVYEDLVDSQIVEDPDSVIESGIIKELVKTLALGGMIRLSSKLLK